MTYQAQDIFGDSYQSDILSDIKIEIENHDILTVIKSEPCTLDNANLLYQKPSRMKINTFCGTNVIHGYCHPKDNTDIETKGFTKYEPATSIHDIITFQSSVVKAEYDELLKCKPKHIKEEEDLTLIDGTSNSSNIETHFMEHNYARPGSRCDIKFEEVDLDMKMEEEEDTSSKFKEEEVGERSELKKTFDCVKCGKKFLGKRYLDGHIVARHNSNVEMMKSVTNRIYCCKHCRYITVKANSLAEHTRIHREKLRATLYCVKCRKGFSNKTSLDSHIVTLHTNNAEMMKSITSKIHCCQHCRYATVRADSLIEHMRMHLDEPKSDFDCIECRKGFSSKTSLDSHIVTLHGNNAEMMKRVTSKIHCCRYCKFITVSTTILFRHIRTHGKQFKSYLDCRECRATFSNRYHLDSHIVQVHNSNIEMMQSVTRKIYHCQHCPYATVRKNDLTQHMKVHGEKFEITFDCIKCEKTFLTKQYLDRHIVAVHSSDTEMMKSVTFKFHFKFVDITVPKRNLKQHVRIDGGN